jgi:hypothetical protein
MRLPSPQVDFDFSSFRRSVYTHACFLVSHRILSFLPMHAVGNYDVPGSRDKACDFIVSSYILALSPEP